MILKVNGKPFSLHPTPPGVLKVVNFLTKAPQDELFLTDDLAHKCNLSPDTMRCSNWPKQKALEGYTAVVGKMRYWGNTAAITELLKQVG